MVASGFRIYVVTFLVMGYDVINSMYFTSCGDAKASALKENTGLLIHDFEGGKYAVYHFKGYPQLLFMVYQEIFCRWLSRTGNQLDERPILDIYRNVREDGYMEIDLCFLLKDR